MSDRITRKTYTLTQLATALNRKITELFGSQRYWVVAELARVGEKGGHYYLELVDTVDRKATAKMQAVIWRATIKQLHGRFGDELHQILKVGNRVLIQVQIDFNNLYGLKLYIDDLDPSITYGDIEKAKQETIDRLKKEGLFERQHELYLPVLAKRLGIVGSPDTSGFRDCMQELTTNPFFTRFQIKTFPASVQGDRALPELIAAIKNAAAYDIDALLVVRGGGSKMDLNVFNQYDLCRTICLLRVPVITGIGHETDNVVAGMVSRENAITPTAAAKGVAQRIGIFRGDLKRAEDGLLIAAQEELTARKDEFAHYQKYFGYHGLEVIRAADQQLSRLGNAVHYHGMSAILQGRNHLDNTLRGCAEYALAETNFEMLATLPNSKRQVEERVNQVLEQAGVFLEHLQEKFYLVNPERLLDQGYTLSTVEGEELRHCEGDLTGKEMVTLTAKRLIRSRIEHSKDME